MSIWLARNSDVPSHGRSSVRSRSDCCEKPPRCYRGARATPCGYRRCVVIIGVILNIATIMILILTFMIMVMVTVAVFIVVFMVMFHCYGRLLVGPACRRTHVVELVRFGSALKAQESVGPRACSIVLHRMQL